MFLIVCLVLAISLSPLAPAALAAATPAPKVDTYDKNNPQNLAEEDIIGAGAIVMDYKTGRVLFAKNADQKLYPASTTKVMTLMLALEYGKLNDTVTIPQEASNVPKDSSIVPLTPGEQMPFIDLLYGLMMRSGNDAAMAVGVIVAGSVENFVSMMNERARELGCENTHFTNPHGYHDETHYSTARDLAVITREAMKSPTFREIVSARSYTMSATDKREKLRLATTNAMFVETSGYYYEYMAGVKTGYHSKAGQCFVGAANKEGAQLISVTLKSTKADRWKDTERLMKYGFSQYETYTFDQIYAAKPLYASIKNADTSDEGAGLLELMIVPGGSVNSLTTYCLPDDFESAAAELMSQLSVNYSSNLVAPIRQGDILGTVSFTTEGGETLMSTVISSRDVLELKPATTLGEFVPWIDTVDFSLLWVLLALFFIVFILILVLRIQHAMRRRRRQRELRRRQRAAYQRYRGAAR